MAKKVHVKKDVCIGCGLCVQIAPAVYEMDDDGLAKEIQNITTFESEAVDGAEQCPVAAIDVE